MFVHLIMVRRTLASVLVVLLILIPAAAKKYAILLSQMIMNLRTCTVFAKCAHLIMERKTLVNVEVVTLILRTVNVKKFASLSYHMITSVVYTVRVQLVNQNTIIVMTVPVVAAM